MQSKVEPDRGGGSERPRQPQPPAAQPSSKPARSDDSGTHIMRLEVSSGTLLKLILVGASLWLVVRLWPVLIVLVVALFVLGTLSPVVQWLEERQVRRGRGIAVVFTGVFILAVLILTLTIPSIVAQAAVAV